MKSLAEIADALLGYDPDALAASSVNAFLADMVPLATQTEALPLMRALGRVLAQDIVSPTLPRAREAVSSKGASFCRFSRLHGRPGGV